MEYETIVTRRLFGTLCLRMTIKRNEREKEAKNEGIYKIFN
jgi:hypothetical protein